MNALYSHWNKEIAANGFNNIQDFIVTLALSVCTSKKNFPKVNLVTTTAYKKLLVDDLQIPFDNVSTSHDQFTELPKWLWAFPKLSACAEQTEPFVHIDNDAFLWKGLPERVKDKPMFFQSLETPFKDFYGWYPYILEYANYIHSLPEVIFKNPVPFAFNCGVIGVNDLSMMKEWFALVGEYLVANQKNIEKNESILIHQNLLHEQYFIASLCTQKKIDVGFIIDYEKLQLSCIENNYTHCWGRSKQDTDFMKRMRSRLVLNHPVYGEWLLERLDKMADATLVTE